MSARSTDDQLGGREEDDVTPGQVEGLDLVRLSDVEPEQVSWLWPGRIPLGKLTLLDGDPGLGKSSLTLDLTARVTRNTAMPCGAHSDLEEPAGVILLTAEDGLGDTIRPRLDAAGADVERVGALQAVSSPGGNRRLPTVKNVDELRASIRAYDARLLIVDPLTAYMGQGTDTHRDSDVRGALAGLAQLADDMNVAVLAIRHLNKSEDSKALYRGGGSIAFTASARSVLLVAKDPSDPSGEGRVLAQLKGNLARQQGSVAFCLQEDDAGSVSIAWLGPSPHAPADLLRASTTSDVSALDQAKHWLRSELSAGPVPAKEVKRRAETFGIAERTLDRAKKDLDVQSDKRGFDDSQWFWKLPEEEEHGERPAAGEDSHDGLQRHDLATFGGETGEDPDVAASSAKNAKGLRDGTLREPANDANSDESGSVREHPDGSEVLSDSAAEDCQELERGPGHEEDADPDPGDSDDDPTSSSRSGMARVPAAWVLGDCS